MGGEGLRLQATYQGNVFRLACFHTCLEWSSFKIRVSTDWEITESIMANFFTLNDQICLFSLGISLSELLTDAERNGKLLPLLIYFQSSKEITSASGYRL